MENARSKAYLMSAALTARLTGGAYLTPGLMWTVTVLLSEEISGGAGREVRTGFSGLSGLNEYRVRLTA